MRKRLKKLFLLVIAAALILGMRQWGIPLLHLWRLNQAQLPDRVQVQRSMWTVIPAGAKS